MDLTSRPRALLAGGAALALTAVVSVVVLVGGGDDEPGQRLAGPEPTASSSLPPSSAGPTAASSPGAGPVASASPSPSSTASGSVTERVSPVPTREGAPAPRPGTSVPPAPRPTCSQEDDGPCPDGRPGWREGDPMGGCQVTAQADIEGARSQEVAPGLVLSLRQRPGRSADSTFVDVVATSTAAYRVDSSLFEAYTAMVGGRGLAVDGLDESATATVGESVVLSLPVFVVGCGDTSRDKAPAVGPGRHDVTARFDVSVTPLAGPGATATPSAAPSEQVRVQLSGTIAL